MDCTKPGKYGSACEFDGTDDRVNLTSLPFEERPAIYTISLWVDGEERSGGGWLSHDWGSHGRSMGVAP